MSIKTCKKCGWQQSTQDPSRRCHGCGVPVTEGICNWCGDYKYDLSPKQYVCSECRPIQSREKTRVWRQKQYYDAYDEWLRDIARIKMPYSFLTEDEWLKVCKYFNGCAFCDSESVDARSFFVPFKKGGRYCNWNIIPKCDKCALLNIGDNPFMAMSRYSAYRKKLLGAVAYLKPIIEELINDKE